MEEIRLLNDALAYVSSLSAGSPALTPARSVVKVQSVQMKRALVRPRARTGSLRGTG